MAPKAPTPAASAGARSTITTSSGGASSKTARRRARSAEGRTAPAPRTSTQSTASARPSPPCPGARNVSARGPRASPRSISRTRQPSGACTQRSTSRPPVSTATSAGVPAKRASRTRARRRPLVTETGTSSREPSAAHRNIVSPLPVRPSRSHRSRKPRANGASPAPTFTNNGAGRSSPATKNATAATHAAASRRASRIEVGGTPERK